MKYFHVLNNSSFILLHMLDKGTCSKIEISRALNLSFCGVSSIVEKLIIGEIIHSEKLGRSLKLNLTSKGRDIAELLLKIRSIINEEYN